MDQLGDSAASYFIWNVTRFFTDTILNLYVTGPTVISKLRVWNFFYEDVQNFLICI